MFYIPTRRSQRHWTVFSRTVCMVRMAGWKRGHDEMYVECVQRVQRLARVKIHASGRERWGTRHLRLTWRYIGHRGRSSLSQNPTRAGIMTAWRPVLWWTEEQMRAGGMRHGRRRFPRMMGQQPEIQQLVGTQWIQATIDKQGWASKEPAWIDLKDVQWSSCRQLSVEY